MPTPVKTADDWFLIPDEMPVEAYPQDGLRGKANYTVKSGEPDAKGRCACIEVQLKKRVFYLKTGFKIESRLLDGKRNLSWIKGGGIEACWQNAKAAVNWDQHVEAAGEISDDD